MKQNKAIGIQMMSCMAMIIALLWLTISTPFIYAAQQNAAKEVANTAANSETEDAPLNNTSEEKSENGASTVSEFLQEVLDMERASKLKLKYFKCHSSDVYFAFHPELVSPPPEDDGSLFGNVFGAIVRR